MNTQEPFKSYLDNSPIDGRFNVVFVIIFDSYDVPRAENMAHIEVVRNSTHSDQKLDQAQTGRDRALPLSLSSRRSNKQSNIAIQRVTVERKSKYDTLRQLLNHLTAPRST